MIVIETDTEAGVRLTKALNDPATYKVSIEPRSETHLVLKVNEQMWSHSMRCNFSDES